MTQQPAWSAEVSIDQHFASRLIERQFPDLASARVAPLGSGWDNTAFLVNDEFVFRFPRRKLGAECLAVELLVLPHLADRLPLPIPRPIFAGKPTAEFGWPFAGYQFLKGRTACSVDWNSTTRETAAVPLATFLKALHHLPVQDFRDIGTPGDLLGRLDPDKRIPLVCQRLSEIAALGLIADVSPWVHLAEKTARVRPPQCHALVHGDLYVRHILVDDGQAVCGVIDWGDVHCGDRASDLSIVFSFLPKSAHNLFRSHYGPIDDETWELARFRALQYGAYLTPFAHSQNDENLLRESLWILKNVLP